MESCWKDIGFAGDHSCSKLEALGHCYNCDVFSEAGRKLLERPAPEGYLEEWSERVAQPRGHSETEEQRTMVAVFRLKNEVLGLPAKVLQVVIPPNPVHHIPHRSNNLFRGLVNVQGKLVLCIALEELLHLKEQSFNHLQEEQKEKQRQQKGVPRMVVMEKDTSTWAFVVDEFYGVDQFLETDQTNLPSLSSKTLENFTDNILRWHKRNVSYLDTQRIFESLRKHIL